MLKSLPKTLLDLIAALKGLPTRTKIEVFEGQTLKDVPNRVLLQSRKATLIILTER
jgi:hypothetical protein